MQQIIMVLKLGSRQFVSLQLVLGTLQLLILEFGVVDGRILALEKILADVDREVKPSAMEQACFFVTIVLLVACIMVAFRKSGLLPPAGNHPYNNTVILTLAVVGFYFTFLKVIIAIIYFFLNS